MDPRGLRRLARRARLRGRVRDRRRLYPLRHALGPSGLCRRRLQPPARPHQAPRRETYPRAPAGARLPRAAAHWGYISSNPALAAGRNRQPSPRGVRVYSRRELDALAAELSAAYRALPVFAAATGLRPEEWQALERRDIDRRSRVLNVLRTISDGEVVELGKTSGARRQLPLSGRAVAALDWIPPRLDTPLVFPAPQDGLLNLDNFRRREWVPAVGVKRPARIYDLRSTFASDALAAK
jgi:integrase